MKKRFLFVFLAIWLSCTSFASVAVASDNNSWNQKFNLAPLNEVFDQIGVWWVASSKFESPAFGNFSLPSWSNLNISNTNAYAYSPTATSGLTFDIFFNPYEDSGKKADFLVLSSLGQTVKSRNHLKHVQYDSGMWDWKITNVGEARWRDLGGGDPLHFDYAPEPASFLLFGLGAAALGIFKRKKK